MSDTETMKISVEEFSRVQKYLSLLKDSKESEAYKEIRIRYYELKVILQGMGVNLTEIDFIKLSSDKSSSKLLITFLITSLLLISSLYVDTSF